MPTNNEYIKIDHSTHSDLAEALIRPAVTRLKLLARKYNKARTYWADKKKSQIITMPVGDLAVIPEQNRHITRSNVNSKKGDKWDPRAVGTIVINVRTNGVLFVVVGQHRVLAAYESFGPSFLFRCQVFFGLSITEEADMWLAHDTDRKPPTPTDKWATEIRSSRVEAQEIEAILEDFDLTVKKDIKYHSTLKTVHGRKNLFDTLEICLSAWPHKPPDIFAASLVNGLSYLLKEYPTINRPVLIRKMSQLTPTAVLTNSKAQGTGTNVYIGVHEYLRKLYNKSRVKDKLRDPD